MNSKRSFALIILIPFCMLTVYAVNEVSYIGIFDYNRHSPAGWQVFADLTIALLLVCGGMIVDAKRSGRNPWPYVVATCFLGSIAPLVYIFLSSKGVSSDPLVPKE